MTVMSKARLTVGAVAAIMLAGLATAPAASAEGLPGLPPLKIKDAKGTFCLTAEASAGLREAGIELRAIAPATIITKDGRSCLTIVAQGEFSLDLQSGSATVEGGFALTRASDGAEVEVTEIVGDMPNSKLTAKVSGEAERIDLVTWKLAEGTVTPDVLTTSVSAQVQLRTTAPTVAVLTKHFGTSPIDAGDPLFDVDGKAELIPAATETLIG